MIFETVVNMSITAAYICAAVFVLRFFMKKLPSKYSYILCLIPFILLLIPVSIGSVLSIFNIVDLPQMPDMNDSIVISEPASEQWQADTKIVQQNEQSQPKRYLKPQEQSNAPNDERFPDHTSNVRYEKEETAPKEKMSLSDILFGLWVCGMAILFMHSTVSVIRLKKRLTGSSFPLRDNIMVCSDTDTPFVFGIIKPKIYLPQSIGKEDVPFVIAHENIHIQRADYIIKPLAYAIMCVHWFNPFLWIMFRLLECDMERSCDEAALMQLGSDARKGYAQALLNISVKKSSLSGGKLVSFGNNSVRQRIKNILRNKQYGIAATVIALMIITVSCVCMLTDPKKNDLFSKDITSACIGIYNVEGGKPGGYEAVTVDVNEIKEILTDLDPVKVEGCPELPRQYTEISAELENSDDSVYRIRLLSPVYTNDISLYRYDSDNNNERTVYEKFMTVEERNSGTVMTSYYELSDNDYDRLMTYLTKKAEVFPEGTYRLSDHSYRAVVKKNGSSNDLYIVIPNGHSPDIRYYQAESLAYGMLLACTNRSEDRDDTAIFFECTGNNKFSMHTNFYSSLSIAGEFEHTTAITDLDSVSSVTQPDNITYSLLNDFLRHFENYSDLYSLGASDVYIDQPFFMSDSDGNMTARTNLWVRFYDGHGKMLPVYYDNITGKWHRSGEFADVASINTFGRRLPEHSFETEAKLAYAKEMPKLRDKFQTSKLSDPETGVMQYIDTVYISKPVISDNGYSVNAYVDLIFESKDLVWRDQLVFMENSYDFSDTAMYWGHPRGTGNPVHKKDEYEYSTEGMTKISFDGRELEDVFLCSEFGIKYLMSMFGRGEVHPENYIADERFVEIATMLDEKNKRRVIDGAAVIPEYNSIASQTVIPAENTDIYAYVMDFSVTLAEPDRILEKSDGYSYYFETQTINGKRRIVKFYELWGTSRDLLDKSGGKTAELDFSEVDTELYLRYLNGEISPYQNRTLIKSSDKTNKGSDWDVHLRKDSESNISMKLYISQTGNAEIYTDNYFFLQYYDLNTGKWENVEEISYNDNITWSDEPISIPTDGSELLLDINWKDLYGVLPEGHWRIAKRLSDGKGYPETIYNYYLEFYTDKPET